MFIKSFLIFYTHLHYSSGPSSNCHLYHAYFGSNIYFNLIDHNMSYLLISSCSSNFIYRICSYLKIVLAAHSLSIIYVLLYFQNLLLFILISSQIYYEFKLFSFHFRNLIFKYQFLTYRFLFVINFFILKASSFIKNVWLLFFLFILDAYYWCY